MKSFLSKLIKFEKLARPQDGTQLAVDTQFYLDEKRLGEEYPNLAKYLDELKGSFELNLTLRSKEGNELGVVHLSSSDATNAGFKGNSKNISDWR